MYFFDPSIKVVWLPPGKSLRLTLPLKMTSPTTAKPFSRKIKTGVVR